MSEAQLLERIDKMASAMQLMATMLGTRLDRGQLAERMNIHRNTLAQRLATGARRQVAAQRGDRMGATPALMRWAMSTAFGL